MHRTRLLAGALFAALIVIAGFSQGPPGGPKPTREQTAARFRQMTADFEQKGLAEPYKGITKDGSVEPGLFEIRATGISTEPVRKAAEALLAALTPEQRAKSAYALDDPEWRKWMNQHFYVRQGVSFEEMNEKQRELGFNLLRAALSARRNPDTLVIARTDALQMNGLDDAIDRCNAYAEAGADVTFVDAPRTREHLEEVARKVDGPKLVNMSETGRSPTLTADELQELGFNIVIFPSTQTWLFARVYQELLEELQKTGTSEGLRDRMMPFDEVNDLLGIARWES